MHLISGWDKRPVSGVDVGLRSLPDQGQLPQLLSVLLVGGLLPTAIVIICNGRPV